MAVLVVEGCAAATPPAPSLTPEPSSSIIVEESAVASLPPSIPLASLSSPPDDASSASPESSTAHETASMTASGTIADLPFFPQYPLLNALPAADIAGTLALRAGCLWLDSPVDVSRVLLWPADYAVAAQGSGWSILDAEGQVVASVGDEVYLGGGEYPEPEDLGVSMANAPKACLAGPFWIVSDVIGED